MALATTLLLGGFSSLTASASEVDTQQPYLWNEETNTVRDISSVVDEQIKDETTFNKPVVNKPDFGGISPRWTYKELVRYDQSTANVNYKYKFVNRVIGDNRSNLYTPLEIWFEAEKSGTFTLEGNVSVEATAEKELVVAKVSGTVSVGASMSRSWTAGSKYGAKTTIPAKVRGAVTGYIPGTSTNGQLVYKITTDSTNEVRYEYKPVGGVVPSKAEWNIVPEIPYNG